MELRPSPRICLDSISLLHFAITYASGQADSSSMRWNNLLGDSSFFHISCIQNAMQESLNVRMNGTRRSER